MYKAFWKKDFENRTKATLQWLEESIKATHYQGSAAYYHLWKGWAPAYPETTGYIIETLFDYADYFSDDHYKKLAVSCADWLCSIQYSDGSFPGGVGSNGQPIIFDTGQILFGLTRTYVETNEYRYLSAIESAVQWLVENLQEDGSWQRFSYVEGYVPSYYTRVTWAILYANAALKDEVITQKMSFALQYYTAKITEQYTIQDWSFAPKKLAYTHTIAYTLEGMLESALILQNKAIIIQIEKIIIKLVYLYQVEGKLAGRYDANWQGDYRFTCVTGNAQLSILLCRFYEVSQDYSYHRFAIGFFEDIEAAPWTLPTKGLQGAIPGSQPLWGAYQRFAFPNWAAKFYLDAYLRLYKMQYE